MPRGRARQWAQWAPVAALAAAALGGFLFYAPTGQYVILPGITGNLNRMVHVAGGRVPRHGRILMVAVTLQPARWIDVLTAPWQPAEELVPASALMPAGMPFSQYVQLSMLQMNESQDAAKTAAFRVLGMPVRPLPPRVYVAGVIPKGPSAGRLQVMDRILDVDGRPVTTASQLTAAVRRLPAGSLVTLTILRGRSVRAVAIRSGHNPLYPSAAFLGVELMQVQPYLYPRQVSIAASDIGGPSAGMMFAMEIVAQVRPEADFPGHRIIAGTGAITAAGQVEPIGGAAEKVVTASRSGAQVFLVPYANYASALRVKERLHLAIRVVPVRTLRQALQAVGYRLPAARG
jgi:PDZ domain-containing protein